MMHVRLCHDCDPTNTTREEVEELLYEMKARRQLLFNEYEQMSSAHTERYGRDESDHFFLWRDCLFDNKEWDQREMQLAIRFNLKNYGLRRI